MDDRIPSTEETNALIALVRDGIAAQADLAHRHSSGGRRQRDLAARVKAGRDAETALVVGHRRLISYICTRVVRRIAGAGDLAYDDLLQEAVIGFVDAIRRYDPSKGSLSNYATWRIRDVIQHYVRTMGSQLAGSYGGISQAALKRYIAPLETRLGRAPTIAELVDAYNETTIYRYQLIVASKPAGGDLSANQLRDAALALMRRRGVYMSVDRAHTVMRLSAPTVALDAPLESDGGDTVTVADIALVGTADTADTALDNIGRERRASAFTDAFGRLAAKDPSMARAVRLRYGFDTGEPLGVTEVAASLGVSHGAAKQLLARGLTALRDLAGADALLAAAMHSGPGVDTDD